MAFHVLTAGLSPFPVELSAWFRMVRAVMAAVFDCSTQLSSIKVSDWTDPGDTL